MSLCIFARESGEVRNKDELIEKFIYFSEIEEFENESRAIESMSDFLAKHGFKKVT